MNSLEQNEMQEFQWRCINNRKNIIIQTKEIKKHEQEIINIKQKLIRLYNICIKSLFCKERKND